MTGNSVQVQVEWAWQGKMPEDRGYRLLASSTGDISAKNFDEILGRFAPGTLEILPQVTVSYVRAGDGSRYLGMAIHEETGSLDRLRRDVTFTRFFCAPYQQLAAGAVSYMAMYQGFERTRLPDTDAAPFWAELSRPATTIPGDAARALPVIELLLTGNPVCIVGAESTSMAERLAYIDTVMSLLPYGMRAEMTASTWAKSSQRLHRFRLFFSDAPRRASDQGVEDHVVRWTPDMMNIARAQGRIPEIYGDEYRQWLLPQLEPSVTTDLAQETKPRAFKVTDIYEMLDSVQDKHQKRFPRLRRREIAVKNEVVSDRAVAVPEARNTKNFSQDRIETLIDGVARILNETAEDTRNIDIYLDGLREELGRGAPGSDESRERYRERIANYNLLRDGLPLAKDKKIACYRVLLRVAFGESLGYLDYCKIEAMLNDQAPDKALIQAIEDSVTASRIQDPRATVLVRYLRKQKFSKSDFKPAELIIVAGDPEVHADHATLFWDMMIAAIGDKRPEERERVIVPLLRDRGFLAFELQARAPADLKYQVRALMQLLTAVYGGFLSPPVFREILAGSRRHYPTLALLLAVCRLSASEHTNDLLTTFMSGLAGSDEVPEDTRTGLRVRLGWDAPGSGVEQATIVPGEAPSTRVEVLTSIEEGRAHVAALQQAGPPRGRRGHRRPKQRPKRSWLVRGEFPVNEEKSRENDDW